MRRLLWCVALCVLWLSAVSAHAADLTGDRLYMLDDGSTPRITRSKRINIDYAGHWKNRLLRFHATHSKAVSGPKKRK